LRAAQRWPSATFDSQDPPATLASMYLSA